MCRDIPQLLVIVTVTFIISINASVWLDQHNIKVIFKQWLALITSFSRAILYIFKWEDSLSLFFCLCIFFLLFSSLLFIFYFLFSFFFSISFFSIFVQLWTIRYSYYRYAMMYTLISWSRFDSLKHHIPYIHYFCLQYIKDEKRKVYLYCLF